ncbi:hypothetical protein [Croceicoccus bisphenolivorans]|uniref:hypothetical protein n=1 Tax=Croceicoccus bisphenolivorans TaxID=1783232 RepID=UPI000A76C573|nr:hypothetical protein [Croceicoccus bisphenolivorans]
MTKAFDKIANGLTDAIGYACDMADSQSNDNASLTHPHPLPQAGVERDLPSRRRG